MTKIDIVRLIIIIRFDQTSLESKTTTGEQIVIFYLSLECRSLGKLMFKTHLVIIWFMRFNNQYINIYLYDVINKFIFN